MTSSVFSRLLRWLRKPFRWGGVRAVRAVLRCWPALCNQADCLLSLVRSIPEQALVPSVNRHIVGMTTIRHAGSETYSFPSELPPAFRTEMHFARRHVYRVRDVCVSVRTGACCTEQHGFQESYGSARRWLLERPVTFGRAVPLPNNGAVTCVHTTAYAHYLMEEAPRLVWALREYPKLNVLVPTILPQFEEDILKALQNNGRLSGEIIRRPGDVNAAVVDHVFTQAEAYSGFWHADDVGILRQTFLSDAPASPGAGASVYISRLRSQRAFNNEERVERFARDNGIAVVYLEGLGFQEQIDLFRNARTIIAGHGGGLANAVWCSPGARVIEIFSHKVFNDCFARLCCRVGCHYTPLWARDSVGCGDVEIDTLKRTLAQQ